MDLFQILSQIILVVSSELMSKHSLFFWMGRNLMTFILKWKALWWSGLRCSERSLATSSMELDVTINQLRLATTTNPHTQLEKLSTTFPLGTTLNMMQDLFSINPCPMLEKLSPTTTTLRCRSRSNLTPTSRWRSSRAEVAAHPLPHLRLNKLPTTHKTPQKELPVGRAAECFPPPSYTHKEVFLQDIPPLHADPVWPAHYQECDASQMWPAQDIVASPQMPVLLLLLWPKQNSNMLNREISVVLQRGREERRVGRTEARKIKMELMMI